MAKERKYAIISDIHANIEALDAVIADATAQGVDEFLCLGDVVGYNASPCECIARIRELNCRVIHGNHDHYCSDPTVDLNDFNDEAAAVIDWTRRQLSQDELEWLRSLPMRLKVFGFGLVHGSLDSPADFRYTFNAEDARDSFNIQDTPICFHGHTHVPKIFAMVHDQVIALPPPNEKVMLDHTMKYFINVGSVGQPRDRINQACYLIYTVKGIVGGTIEYRRVDYDIESTAARIEAAGLPTELGDRLFVGK